MPATAQQHGAASDLPPSGKRSSRTDDPRPLLASEVLADERAPLEPGAHGGRVWLMAAGAGLAILGVALSEGVGVPSAAVNGASTSFSAAAGVVALALLPFPYALRAAVALLIGAALMTMGIRGAGPLAGLLVDGGQPHALARLIVVSTLPAALLLRSHYTLAREARVVLGVAWVAALPFLGVSVLLCADGVAPGISRVAAAANIGVVLCCLFGFMPESSGGSTVWAALVLVVLPASIALRELTPLAGADTGLMTYTAAAWGVLWAGILVTVGAFHLLAAVVGPRVRARMVKKRATPTSPKLNVVGK